jgi:hypothetical protein
MKFEDEDKLTSDETIPEKNKETEAPIKRGYGLDRARFYGSRPVARGSGGFKPGGKSGFSSGGASRKKNAKKRGRK